MSYISEYKQSVDHPALFWSEKAKDLEWFDFPQKILSQDSEGINHWFSDGKMNTCHMAVDYHVNNGRGEQTAIIYDSPVTDTKKSYTYSELRKEVAKCAGMIKAQGVEKGDRVIIYMPMIPESVFAMLACARLGAIHSVVFGGFASPELAVRIDDAKPKLILSASCGIEINRVIEYKPLLDGAIELAKHKVNKCIIYQREQSQSSMIDGRDIDWESACKIASEADCLK